MNLFYRSAAKAGLNLQAWEHRFWIILIVIVTMLSFLFISNQQFVQQVRAVAGDGATSNIQLLDTNANGEIDRITFDIANPNTETWTLNNASPHGLTVTQAGNDITISGVSLTTGAAANPVGIQVDLDETDLDLVVDTNGVATNAVELIYTQVVYANCAANPSICDSVDEELNAIATGDTGATDTEADGAAPVTVSATFLDATSNDGKLDIITSVWSENLNVVANGAADWAVTSAADFSGLVEGTVECNSGAAGANECDYNFTTTTVKTSVGDLNLAYTAGTSVTDGTNNAASITYTSASTPAFTDGANPILTAVALSLTGNRNRLTFTYSENITVTDGASTATKGDTTAAGTVAGFGSLATVGNTTVATTDNTVAGNGTAILTLDLADQAAAFLAGTSTTEPSGVFTPVASAELVDAAALQVNTNNTPTATGGGSWDLAKPSITSLTLSDAVGNNGRVDRGVLVIDEAIRDANVTDADATLGAGAGTFTTGAANDATTTFNLTADTLAIDTSATAASFLYSGATSSMTDRAGNLLNTATDGQIVAGDVVETDGANPILTAVALSLTGNRNRLTFTYSENITVTDGASTATKGDTTAAGTVAGFGSFATAGNTTVATTDNTVAGNGTASLTLDLADQAAAFLVGTSTTEPSGVFTPVASAVVADAVALQVNTNNTPTATGGGSWDLAKPSITSLTLSDAVGNNGRVDRGVLVIDEAIRDANVTDADATLGAGAGTFTTGAANDATTTFNLTADTLAIDTSATAASFLYSGATSSMTDRAGNLLNTATDGQIAAGDVVETDGANPILTAVALSLTGNRNRLTFTYSENITVADGASTATKGDTTAAGTVAGFGTFATTGTVTVPTTDNTVAGNGTASLTLDLADQAAAFMNTASTVEPSGVFTPVASAVVADAAALQVNTNNTPTATGGASWDLTKPSITSLTLSDAVGNNGRVDRGTLVVDEPIRDANVTNADGALGGNAGTFTSGAANDATTTFNVTADTLAIDTSATAAEFTYSALTTRMTDRAGNMLNTATDGSIVAGDVVETDGANPILTAVALSLTANRNRLTFTYSENMTVADGASTATKGDTTAAGTVAGFGTFATTGNTTVATTDNTVSGNGTATLTLDLADQAAAFLAGTSTTEPSGVFTPVASAVVADAGALQVNVGNTPTATGGATWDLAKPTISNLRIYDLVGDNGRVETAQVQTSEPMRDANVTDADGDLSGGGGTFATGAANDAITTFTRTADTLAIDTSATAADFTYSGATTLWTDRAGNLLNTATDGQIASGDAAEEDFARPVILSGVYEDNNGDGRVDQVVFTTSTDAGLTCTAFTATTDFTVGTAGTVNIGESGGDGCASNGTTTVTISLGTPGAVDTTGGGTDPIVTYTQPGNGVEDGAAQDLRTNAGLTITDNAAPRISTTTVTYQDLNTNGTVDNLSVTWTENIDAVGAFAPGNHIIVNGVVLTFVAPTATDDPANASNILNVTVLGAANVTGDAVAPTYTYTNTGNNYIQDGTGNIAVTQAAFNMVDGAGPVSTAAEFLDTNNNGVVDRVDVTMTNDTGLTCAFEAGDWTFPTPGTINLTGATACAIATNTIQLTVAGNANTTGGAANPTTTYTDQGAANQVQDGTANDAIVAIQAITDNAAPVASTLSPIVGATGVGDTDDIIVTFTEPMTTGGFTAGIVPAVGVITNVWSNGNATLTASHGDPFAANTNYTVTLTGTDASPATVALVAGIAPTQPRIWQFGAFAQSSIQRRLALQQQNELTQEPTTDEPSGEPGTEPDTEQPTEPEPDDLQIISPDSPLFHLTRLDPAPAQPLPQTVHVGSLVKLADRPAVYFIDGDNRRHPFPNEATFLSWFKDFSSVGIISPETLTLIPLGSNVVMRPGTWLIKIRSDNRVFAVEPYGIIRWLPTEEVAQALYGPNWNQRVMDIDIAFFANYTLGNQLAGNQHPTGSLIQYGGSAERYYIENDTKRLVTDDVFSKNLFRDAFAIKGVPTAISYTPGDPLPEFKVDIIMTLR